MNNSKDLSKQAPRSPREQIGGYVILARALDKGRAAIDGHPGDFHFDCPLDNQLFGFKGVKGDEVKKLLETGASDQEVASWLDTHGAKKSPEEIKAWNGERAAYKFDDDAGKKEWFTGEVKKMGLDPDKTTLFDYLEADDKQSFPAK